MDINKLLRHLKCSKMTKDTSILSQYNKTNRNNVHIVTAKKKSLKWDRTHPDCKSIQICNTSCVPPT